MSGIVEALLNLDRLLLRVRDSTNTARAELEQCAQSSEVVPKNEKVDMILGRMALAR